MKKLLFTAAAVSFFSFSNAQVTTPQPSTHAKSEYTIGLTNISVEYSRPSAKGREVFGDLVPYGKIWRTGANLNTIFETSDDITFEGQLLKAGKYSIYTIPEKHAWTVLFYTDINNGGVPTTWDESKIALKTKAAVDKITPEVETFTIGIDNQTMNDADLIFTWQRTRASLKMEVPTDKKVMASIESTMSGTPTDQDYLNAGNYYYSANKDIKQAMEWYDKGVKMMKEPRYWNLRQQSLIHAKAGDKEGAIRIAKLSLAAAKKAGNQDYVKMNEDSIKEWMGK